MKRSILIISLLLSGAVAAQAENTLERGFKSPPPECRPDLFYQAMGGMVTKEGLKKDLEAMAREGIGGTMLMQMPDALAGAVQWTYRDYPGKIKCLSDEWFAMWNYAIGESDRLGLTFSAIPCGGWSHVGGPWVTPEKGLKVLVGESTQIKGPSHFDGLIARKPVFYEEGKPAFAPWATNVDAWKKLKESWGDYYRDVAVIAYPASEDTSKKPVPSDKMLDLTAKMDSAGHLKWDVPDGNWTVVRLGYATFNGPNYPAQLEASGLECDRMDANAVNLVMNNYIGRMVCEARAKGYKSFKGFDTDSYESGNQDFCYDFAAQFKKRMGYDCTPWLPAWLDTKLVIGSADLTNRFRRDMLQVVSDLWIERFYAGIRRFSDDNHVTWMIEPYFKLTIDWRTIASKADIAGGEFWVKGEKTTDWFPDLIGPAPDTAALYGKSVVWAEAFTAGNAESAWRNDPWLLKPFGDAAFCRGINHFVMHGFAHNPFGDNIKPGISFGFWGTQFSRNVTWWPYSSAWHRYLARCQFMLTQGQPVSDVLAYPPRVEHIPCPVLDCAPFKQNVCNDEILFERLSIKDGRIVLPHGVSYAAMAIPSQGIFAYRSMTPHALKRIRDLVNEGMTLIGEPVPAKSVSMKNYPECDKEMAGLIAEIWGDTKTAKQGERKLGKGRVIWGRPIVEVLSEITGGADFDSNVPFVVQGKRVPRYDFFHRHTPEAEIYFVANLGDDALDMTANFRVTGRKPQLWDAVTGQMRTLPQYSEKTGRTTMPLHFAPQQSFFVIFEASSQGKPDKSKENFPAIKPLVTIEGPWQVAFDPKWGGPEKIEFANLEDWTKRPEKGIKYYSGTATYSKMFDVPKSAVKAKSPVYLDLGKVKNLARVRLNGKDMGIIWCAPWRVDVGGALKAKGNRLEIDVVNTWVNRIIGDEQEPLDCEMVKLPKTNETHVGGYIEGVSGTGLKDLPDWLLNGQPRPSKGRYTFVNWQFYNKGAPLLESGLIGPVQILVQE